MKDSSTDPSSKDSSSSVSSSRSTRPIWQLYLKATLSTVLPFVLAMSALESPLFSLDEPAGSVRTPNPAKASHVSKANELLVLIGPSFAVFAGRWFYVFCAGTILWIAIAPQLWIQRQIQSFWARQFRRLGLVPTSIVFGTVMAWPWLFAIVVHFGGFTTLGGID